MEISVVTSVSFAKTGVIMLIDIINTNIIIIFFEASSTSVGRH